MVASARTSSAGSVEIEETKEGVSFLVKVSPRASVSRVEGYFEGALKVRIAAAPVDGAANKELFKVLADFFGVAKTDVSLPSGKSSKTKRVSIRGLAMSAAKRALERLG